MKNYKAELLFSCTSIRKDSDDIVRTLYKCPNCNNELVFSEKDFLRCELNRTTKFKDLVPEHLSGNCNSFLEFQCPNCQIRTRIVFGIYYGDKYPFIKIDSVLTE